MWAFLESRKVGNSVLFIELVINLFIDAFHSLLLTYTYKKCIMHLA